MRVRRARVSAILCSVALVLAACGDDDDDAGSTTATEAVPETSAEAPATSADTPAETTPAETTGDTAAADTTEADAAPIDMPDSVKIVASADASFSEGVILETQRLMREDGVEVNQEILEDTPTALRTVIGGSADIYFGDPMLVLLAVQNGDAPIKYLASTVQATDYVLLATPEWELDNLAGAVVGSAGPGTSGTVIGDAALTKLGVDISQLEYLEVGGTSARVTAILNGQIDIAAAHAADAIPPLKAGNLKVLLNAGEVLGPYVQQGMIIRQSFIDEYPEYTQLMIDHMIEAARTADSGYDAYKAFFTEAGIDTGLTPEEETDIYDQFKTAGVWAVNGGVCDEIVNSTLDYNIASGTIDEASLIDLDKWMDRSFVEKSLEDEGGLQC